MDNQYVLHPVLPILRPLYSTVNITNGSQHKNRKYFECYWCLDEWFAQNQFDIALIGYGIIGIAQIFCVALPVYLAESLFSAYRRTLVISLTSNAMAISISFAFTCSSMYFIDMTEETQFDGGIKTMNLYVALFNSANCVNCLLTLWSDEHFAEQVTYSEVVTQILSIITSEDKMLDMLFFAIYIGNSWAYLGVISIELYLCNFTQLQVTYIALVFQWVGITLGIAISIILDRQVQIGKIPNLDLWIKILSMTGFVLLILEAMITEYLNYTFMIIVNAFIGIGLLSTQPLQLLALSEKMYPVNSVVLCTILYFLGNAFGFLIGYIMMIPQLTNYSIMIALVFLTPCQLYISLFYKTKFNKHEQTN